MSLQLTGPCCWEDSIKRSRFVAYAAPVASADDALAVLDHVADHSATHNCWAWRIDAGIRFNDDGEPAGTAGRPILSVLEARDLVGVMLIVTRYYGGIKLGAGGLVRAYSGTAARCLDRGKVEPRIVLQQCEVQADFALADPLHQLLERHGAVKHAERYDARGVTLTVDVPESALEPMRAELDEISRGQARFRRR